MIVRLQVALFREINRIWQLEGAQRVTAGKVTLLVANVHQYRVTSRSNLSTCRNFKVDRAREFHTGWFEHNIVPFVTLLLQVSLSRIAQPIRSTADEENCHPELPSVTCQLQ